jgi:hypothetical protein
VRSFLEGVDISLSVVTKKWSASLEVCALRSRGSETAGLPSTLVTVRKMPLAEVRPRENDKSCVTAVVNAGHASRLILERRRCAARTIIHVSKQH